MTSTQLLNQVSELSSALGEATSDADELHAQLRAFSQEQLPDEEMPVALPQDFDPTKARAELDSKLLSVHRLRGQLTEAESKFRDAQKAEVEKAFAAYKREYHKTILDMLKSAVNFAKSLEAADKVRDEVFHLTGQNRLVHIGPTFAQWSLKDHSSLVSHWLREGRDAGILTGNEPWLDGVTW